MTVEETGTVDQVAIAPDGTVTLVMTEVRAYGPDVDERLGADSRAKLDAYLEAIRSGQIAKSLPRRHRKTTYAIELSCGQTPPPQIVATIERANSTFGPAGVAVRYRVLDSLAALVKNPALMPMEELLQSMATIMSAVAPAGSAFTEYQTAIVVGRSQDRLLMGTAGSMQLRDIDPPERRRELILWVKHGMYEPGRGTWLSAVLRRERDATFVPRFNFDELPPWFRALEPSCYRDELTEYPRDPEHVPRWWRSAMA